MGGAVLRHDDTSFEGEVMCWENGISELSLPDEIYDPFWEPESYKDEIGKELDNGEQELHQDR